MARRTPPFEVGVSLYFASLDRGKRSVVLDLKSAAGQEALHRLLKTADVLVEDMRPGVRNRIGCSDHELARVNPRLIRASISGFGQDGSLLTRPAYDIVMQAMSGIMSINGPLGGPPTRVGFSVGDICAELFIAVGILERLYRRDAGHEEHLPPLDVSMLACQWACLENAFARYLNAGILAETLGSRHPSMTPFEVYPTADRDIVIGLGDAKDWPVCCTNIGKSEWTEDPRFADDATCLQYKDEPTDLLSEHLTTIPADHWLARLHAASIPCSLTETVETFANKPIADEYSAFSHIESSCATAMRFVRNPLAARGQIETAAPELGSHTAEVLAELGYEDSKIRQFLSCAAES